MRSPHSFELTRTPSPTGDTSDEGRVYCGSGTVAYVARYRDPSNRERSRSFPRRSDAERFVASAEADVNRGAWIDPERGRETLASFWRRWRTSAGELNMPSERTLIAYDELWRLYVGPALRARRLDSITRADVLRVVEAARQRSVWRATDALKVTRRLLNAAVDEELILRNPASRVPRTCRASGTMGPDARGGRGPCGSGGGEMASLRCPSRLRVPSLVRTGRAPPEST
jgi:hypothetical protein